MIIPSIHSFSESVEGLLWPRHGGSVSHGVYRVRHGAGREDPRVNYFTKERIFFCHENNHSL